MALMRLKLETGKRPEGGRSRDQEEARTIQNTSGKIRPRGGQD